eukprot:705947-Alexandrium_andersonii.AAC.1
MFYTAARAIDGNACCALQTFLLANSLVVARFAELGASGWGASGAMLRLSLRLRSRWDRRASFRRLAVCRNAETGSGQSRCGGI